MPRHDGKYAGYDEPGDDGKYATRCDGKYEPRHDGKYATRCDGRDEPGDDGKYARCDEMMANMSPDA